MGVFGSFLFLLSYGIRHSFAHLGHLLVSSSMRTETPAAATKSAT
jgi:hypothetical protein